MLLATRRGASRITRVVEATVRAAGTQMKVLFVHPSSLMYSEVYLRLEPLGLELVAQAARDSGHAVRLLDLQVFTHRDYFLVLDQWKPDAVGFSLNYLANIPEVVDLALETRRRLPRCFIFAGGHSASFTAKEILAHAAGGLDCVVRGERSEERRVGKECRSR